jgi:hypothetical protein
MKKEHFAIILLLLISTLHFGTPSAIADFGNYSGDSDYGSSSSKPDYSSPDYSSPDYSRYDSGRDRSSGEGSPAGVIIFLIAASMLVVIPLAVIHLTAPKQGDARTSRPVGATPTDPSKLRPISEYCQRDANFSEPELQEKISNLYVQMQNCWTAKNMESLRPCFTDTAYAQFDRLLDSFRKNCRTNYVERISVLGVSLLGWYGQEGNDCMVANVQARIVDYTRDDKTGDIISGSSTAEKFMTYEYLLVRGSGYATNAQDEGAKTFNCPQCGISLDINHSAKCPCCSSIITAKDHHWVISSIKGIAQSTH